MPSVNNSNTETEQEELERIQKEISELKAKLDPLQAREVELVLSIEKCNGSDLLSQCRALKKNKKAAEAVFLYRRARGTTLSEAKRVIDNL